MYNHTVGSIADLVNRKKDSFLDNLMDVFNDPHFPFVNLNSTTNTGRNFPPYNIVELKNGSIRLDMAVAGFNKEDLSVELEDSLLVLRGSRKGKTDEKVARRIKVGISEADWVRTFNMEPNCKVDQVALQDGILSIHLSTGQLKKTKKTFQIS